MVIPEAIGSQVKNLVLDMRHQHLGYLEDATETTKQYKLFPLLLDLIKILMERPNC